MAQWRHESKLQNATDTGNHLPVAGGQQAAFRTYVVVQAILTPMPSENSAARQAMASSRAVLGL